MAPRLRGAAEWPCGHSRETLMDSNNGDATALHPNEDWVAGSHRASQDGLRLPSPGGSELPAGKGSEEQPGTRPLPSPGGSEWQQRPGSLLGHPASSLRGFLTVM